MITFTFEKKPSITSIRARVIKLINAGERHIELRWGEYWLELQKVGHRWEGSGWIDKHGGADLAEWIMYRGRS